jgi:hypothetical protein
VFIFHGIPWWNWALQLFGLVSSYIGAVMNSRLDVRGFYVWLFSNSVLLVLHVIAGCGLLWHKLEHLSAHSPC